MTTSVERIRAYQRVIDPMTVPQLEREISTLQTRLARELEGGLTLAVRLEDAFRTRDRSELNRLVRLIRQVDELMAIDVEKLNMATRELRSRT